MLIRDLGVLWQTAIKMTAVKELLDTHPTMIENNKEEHNIQLICQKYIALIQLAHTYGIENCYQWKHLVDGKRAAQVVGVKPGPVLTELLKIQMTWQLENPQGTKEKCEKALEEYWKSK